MTNNNRNQNKNEKKNLFKTHPKHVKHLHNDHTHNHNAMEPHLISSYRIRSRN